MIYPEIGRLTSEILARKKHIYLCTNGMFIRKHLSDFTPTSRFFFNVHLDGLEKTHDICVERDGVFREAVKVSRLPRLQGFSSLPTRQFTRRRTSKRSLTSSLICRRWASMATCFPRPIPMPR